MASVNPTSRSKLDGRERAKRELYEGHPYGTRTVLKKLDPAKKYRGKRVLIAGCGAGARLFDLHFYGADVTAIDQSNAAVSFIREQFRLLDSEPPELRVGDVERISLPADTFDYVVCFGVLHHTSDPGAALENFRKALKPGGKLEVLLYHKKSLVRLERKLVEQVNRLVPLGRLLSEEVKETVNWWDKYENPIWDTYSRDEARALVEDAGFSVDEVWLANSPFGQFANLLIPPLLRKPAERLLDGYRWHVRIDATNPPGE